MIGMKRTKQKHHKVKIHLFGLCQAKQHQLSMEYFYPFTVLQGFKRIRGSAQ